MSLKIDQAFTQAFIDGAFGIDIVHENVDYNPSDAEDAHAEIRVLPNPKTPVTNNTDEARGVFRVILRYPVNEGAIPAKTKAEEIMDYFKPLSEHSYDGVTATVVSSGRQGGFPEEGWYKQVLTFTYTSYNTRA